MCTHKSAFLDRRNASLGLAVARCCVRGLCRGRLSGRSTFPRLDESLGALKHVTHECMTQGVQGSQACHPRLHDARQSIFCKAAVFVVHTASHLQCTRSQRVQTFHPFPQRAPLSFQIWNRLLEENTQESLSVVRHVTHECMMQGIQYFARLR
jgi:hypothetical protein